MAQFTVYTLMAIAAAACIVDVANADITCYLCITGCDDPFTPSASTSTCTGQQCSKTVSTVSAAGASATVTTRGCSVISSGSNTCQTGTYAGYSGTQCTCATDKCNTAARSLASGHVMMAALSVLALFVGRRLL